MTAPQPVAGQPPFASLGQRIGAYVVDGLAAWLVLLVVAGPVLLLADMLVASVAGAVAALAFAIAQLILLGSRGYTVGKAALGLRVLDEATGLPIGFGRALVRQLVLGISASLVVPLVLSVIRIPSDPRRQGWHDRVAHTVEVVRPKVATSPAPAPQPMGNVPQPAGPVPSGPVPSGPAPANPVPFNPTAPTEAAQKIDPVSAPVMPPDPAASIAPVVVPPRQDGGMVGPPPGLLARSTSRTGPREASQPKSSTAPPAPTAAPSVPEAPVAPRVAPAPPNHPNPFPPTIASPKLTVQPPAQPAPPPAPPAPPSQAAPPPVSAVPPTVAAPRRPLPPAAPAQPLPTSPADAPNGWLLRLSTGSTFPVTSETLIGRDPEATLRPGAALLPVADPAFTVSKTHAALTPWGTTLWLEDLDSTHGVVVRRNHDEMQVEPGTRTRLLIGDILLLGVFQITVEAV